MPNERDEHLLPTSESPSPCNGPAKQPTRSLGGSLGGWGAIMAYQKAEISLHHADLPIIACCLVSGLCDSSAYNAWSCFVSMQTGNTIFLALGASGQPLSHPYGWSKSLVSITAFLLGCFFFSNTRLINPRSRGTLSSSFLLQALCIIVAAALVEFHVVPEPQGIMADNGADVNFKEFLPLGFLAFQSGGQISTSRLLGFNEVPTTVLTSVYCDLASDPRLVARDNVKRNRRVAAILSILAGGIAGGWISRSKAGMATSLWIAAGIKLAISIAWTVWRPAAKASI